MEICKKEGWSPDEGVILRFVKLQEEVIQNKRNEEAVGIDPHKLEFYKWLAEHGRLSEGAS